MLGFCLHAGDLNSGSYAFRASALLTELSPHTPKNIFYLNYFSWVLKFKELCLFKDVLFTPFLLGPSRFVVCGFLTPLCSLRPQVQDPGMREVFLEVGRDTDYIREWPSGWEGI